MISPVVSNGMYVILGANGNTGSIIADSLLLKARRCASWAVTRGDCSALCATARRRSRPT
jgi:hypothetical protein